MKSSKLTSKKRVFTLALEGYPKEITDLTFPLIKRFCHKIGAEFVVIKDRKFLDFPPTYEKMQVYELGEGAEWVYYIDADALIHPNLYDISAVIPKDTVFFTGKDMAAMRCVPDKYFLRDGRYLGACTWFVLCSEWTLDLWHPLEDMTADDVAKVSFPILQEEQSGLIEPVRLIDDYVLSRNIARYGLKHTTLADLTSRFDRLYDTYYHHVYGIPLEEKLLSLRSALDMWGIKYKKESRHKVKGC